MAGGAWGGAGVGAGGRGVGVGVGFGVGVGVGTSVGVGVGVGASVAAGVAFGTDWAVVADPQATSILLTSRRPHRVAPGERNALTRRRKGGLNPFCNSEENISHLSGKKARRET